MYVDDLDRHLSDVFIIQAWRKHLDANADPRCVSVVAGNKSDMEEQIVSPEEGMAYAKEVSLYRYASYHYCMSRNKLIVCIKY